MSLREAGIHIHEEWKGMVQPVGLVVEPTVLDRLGIFPEKNIRVLSDLQIRLESLFNDQLRNGEICSSVNNLKEFFKEVLGWQDGDLLKLTDFYSNKKEEEIGISLDDYEEILKPDWIVPDINIKDKKKNIQILIKELEIGTPFDQVIKDSDNKKKWEATPQQKFERLLKESENPVGILWNGVCLRLIYAPRGESSGHITFPLEPMISVDGRPMIGALEMLLGPDRLFEGGSSNLRLRNLMELSRKEQNEVSNRLSEQVLDALWLLVRGLDDAEGQETLLNKTILDDLPEKDPSHIYGGLITVLLRLVFLLYSEDEELMPKDSLYVENYSVSGLAAKLRRDRTHFQGAMSGRRGAWGSLLSLFRVVFDGGGPYEDYLPARHGELFDPDAYPFLEGRKKGTSYKDEAITSLPPISDDVVERVLNKLLLLDGQILSYRSLDVEQIGSVYESIMGFTIEKTKAFSIGIIYRPPRQKINLTIVINAEDLISQDSSKREKWLKDEYKVDFKLSPKIKSNLKKACDMKQLCDAFDNKLSSYIPRGLNKNSLILQPTSERKRSGSHYTPRILSEPIVEDAFRPWLEKFDYSPSEKEILSLKVCDPAMGSGAFLVAACRFMANYLVASWSRDGFPQEFDNTIDKDIYARRLIAQNCLYGVDKNPFAVSLAKLSLWLITLSKDLPFTFVDHSLKCGDSIVGFSVKEIQSSIKELQLPLISFENQFLDSLSIERKYNFSKDNRDDISYDFKKKLLEEQFMASDQIRIAGDLMVAAFFEAKTKKERFQKQQSYLSLLANNSEDKVIKNEANKIRQNLFAHENGINPFHWDLEFPEVFVKGGDGFDIFIGNPPFAGKNTISEGHRNGIIDWFKKIHLQTHGNSDLVAHFFRRCFNLLKKDGSFGLIATNTISEGDTRNTGLKWICLNGGNIYSAQKRLKWPGVASVIVSVVHLLKGDINFDKKLDGKKVDNITAFLLSNGSHEDPYKLVENANKSFIGSYVLGMGFTFDDSGESDIYTPGTPLPINFMKLLIGKNQSNSEVIFPYLGGDAVNSNTEESSCRYVINFKQRCEKECRENWPEIMEILEKKVKGTRASHSTAPWWQFERLRGELYKQIEEKPDLDKVLVSTRVQSNWQIAFTEPNQVFSDSLVVFPFSGFEWFSILQSSIHEIWARHCSSTLGYALRYTPSDCFETFPFPVGFSSRNDFYQQNNQLKMIKVSGKEYYEFRSIVMKEENIGLTELFNRLNSPMNSNNNISKLRNLHSQNDKNIIDLYGWNDIDIIFGFGIDYLNIEDEIELPLKLRKEIDKGDLFFLSINEACEFANKLISILGNKTKLNWKYRLPNNVRIEILSRLLSLNNDMYVKQEQENQPLTIDKILKEDNSQLNINF